jgi:hypothetical protein
MNMVDYMIGKLQIHHDYVEFYEYDGNFLILVIIIQYKEFDEIDGYEIN